MHANATTGSQIKVSLNKWSIQEGQFNSNSYIRPQRISQLFCGPHTSLLFGGHVRRYTRPCLARALSHQPSEQKQTALTHPTCPAVHRLAVTSQVNASPCTVKALPMPGGPQLYSSDSNRIWTVDFVRRNPTVRSSCAGRRRSWFRRVPRGSPLRSTTHSPLPRAR